MKNRKRIILAVILILLIASSVYIIYHNSSFVQKNFEKYTGVNNYQKIMEYHDNSESFFQVKLSSEEKNKLLNKFAFSTDLSKIKGKAHCSFICECKDHKYFVIEDGNGPYGYILFALEDNGYVLSVYEAYGD